MVSSTSTDVMTCESSITDKYLAQKAAIELTHTTRKSKALIIHGASEHNLQHIDVSIPIQQLVVITGVSGSGKSTFLFDILDKIARKHLHRTNEDPGKYTSIE